MADPLIISRPLSKKGERERGRHVARLMIGHFCPVRPSVRPRPSAMLMDATDARMSCFIVEVDLVDRAKRQQAAGLGPSIFHESPPILSYKFGWNTETWALL